MLSLCGEPVLGSSSSMNMGEEAPCGEGKREILCVDCLFLELEREATSSDDVLSRHLSVHLV